MKTFSAILALCASASFLYADAPQDRLKDATDAFQQIMKTPDKGIPQSLLDKAGCIVIVPGVKSAAFVFGGKYGKGFAMCRENRGRWGAPAAVTVEGGSFGLQIGVSNTDVIMLVMSDRGMRALLTSKFTIGAQAAGAAGPVGRSTQAMTDAQLRADILSWSRSRGLFAGISLEGATLRPDNDENRRIYHQKVTNKEILMSHVVGPPAGGRELVALLDHYSPREAGAQPIETQAERAVEGKPQHEAARQAPAQPQPQPQVPSHATVRQAQKELKNQGLYPGKLDGIYGPKTEAAVRQYQQKQNLPVTGTLDEQTRGKLGIQSAGEASRAETAPVANVTPATITAVQRKLKEQGFYKGPVNGQMGPQTEAAIREYQKNANLNATGHLDQGTVDKLGVSK